MKYLYTLLAFVFLFSASLKSQNYIISYNPYSGMNNAQLELALEQSSKMEQNGKIWTVVGSGMLIGGGVLTFNGIRDLSFESSDSYGSFAAGLGIMCFGAFPLGYGLVAWLTGSEKAKLIEIELLASDRETLSFKPTEDGYGLVLAF